MEIYKKLFAVQQTLKAPKGQRNDFGKYNYRSCEDIVEAAKPVLAVQQLLLSLSDELVLIGDRYYIKATARVVDITDGEKYEVYAYAREEESKKGMDGSQVTGASSSYARKYALNGLFGIDDTKDSDATNTGEIEVKAKKEEPKREGKYFCEECGHEILPYKGKDGNPISLKAHSERSMKKFGKVLCLDCIQNQ